MVLAFCSSVELRTLVAKTAAPGKSPSRGRRQRTVHQASQPPTIQNATQPRKTKRAVSMLVSAPETSLIQVSGLGSPSGIPGWAALRAPWLMNQGTTAAPAPPSGRATKVGMTRIVASTVIASTPRTATPGKISEPLTHCMVTVEPATTRVRRRTSTTDGSSAGASRARSARARRAGALPAACSTAASLDQADRISRLHEAAEVITLADDEELDVGVEVEGQVRLGGPEAGRVDVEGHPRGPLLGDRLQVPEPG